ncbi:SAV_915 family protein [Streptomyces tremellae]|uniref:SseB protein N-terminal domain-containing protein n=1 Tax=Streptomyces tremellae TaxID=1124239 RepID=A0ABP7E4M7_9ACTN
MPELPSAEAAEPAPSGPAAPLVVPVLPDGTGYRLRLFRTPLGGRTAVAFTSPRLLAATLGAGRPWIRLAEPALRALAQPLGVTALTVDPQLAAPRPAPVAAPLPAAVPAPRPGRTDGPTPLVGPVGAARA